MDERRRDFDDKQSGETLLKIAEKEYLNIFKNVLTPRKYISPDINCKEEYAERVSMSNFGKHHQRIFSK